MAGINYETELNERLKSIDNPIDIDKARVTSYYGIGGFMEKLCTSLNAVDEELANIKTSFSQYNDVLNSVPFPLSPDVVEQNLSGETKYKIDIIKNNEEIL